MCALRRLVLGERLRRVDLPEARLLRNQLLRGLDAEPQREHRAEPRDLHRTEAWQCADPLLQVGAVGRLGPHALGVPAVFVGDDGAQLLHTARHRTGEAVDGRALAKDHLELGWIQRRDRRRVERADPLTELQRSGERGRHRHLLIEREPD